MDGQRQPVGAGTAVQLLADQILVAHQHDGRAQLPAGEDGAVNGGRRGVVAPHGVDGNRRGGDRGGGGGRGRRGGAGGGAGGGGGRRPGVGPTAASTLFDDGQHLPFGVDPAREADVVRKLRFVALRAGT